MVKKVTPAEKKAPVKKANAKPKAKPADEAAQDKKRHEQYDHYSQEVQEGFQGESTAPGDLPEPPQEKFKLRTRAASGLGNTKKAVL